ncbi:MAG: hypothetical protein EAX96_13835 [Candidatus Lokiarchaeota archaeon]|nr:hypothetical protein [Candidatus Lokiarchaeota archaeon]
MFEYEENVEKILLKLAEDFNGEELDLFTLRFRELQLLSETKVFYNTRNQSVDISTKLEHSVQTLESSIHVSCDRNNIFSIYNETEVPEILDDLFFQLKYLVLREIQQNPPKYEFTKIEEHSTEDITTFCYQIPYYGKKFEELDELIREKLKRSFDLIYEYKVELGEYIIYSVNLYKIRPHIERKLLEIRKNIWSAQLYYMSSGRFAGEQRHRYLKYLQDGKKLFEEFKTQYPEIDTTQITLLFELFEEKSED